MAGMTGADGTATGDYDNDFYNLDDDYTTYPTNDYDEYCQWREVEAYCGDFQFIEGDCSITASYSPCVTDHFNCASCSVNEYGEVQCESCAEDFEDVQFWSMMREEAYWQYHPEHAEFYQFWEQYHFGEQCEDKMFQGSCSDFNMLEGEECVLVV
jgi:hypothetical protein